MPSPPKGTAAYDAWASEDKGPGIIAYCWTFLALATFFMACRMYVRLAIFRKLRSDDYWCLAGLFFAYLSTCLTMVAIENGNGRHSDTLTITQQENVRLYTIAAFCPGVISFGLPKFAVVDLLTRLMNPSKWHRRFLWGMCIVCLLTLLATIGTLLGQCTPTRAMWNFDMEKTCVDIDHIVGFSLYAGALSAFVDLYLAIYPTVVLLQLQMKIRKKLALSAALSIGAVGGAIAIYKTTRVPSGLSSPDFSYDSADLINWTIIEGATIIIAATIPVLSPLMDKLFHGRNPFSSTRKTGGSEKGRPAYYIDRKGRHGRSHISQVSAVPRQKTNDSETLKDLAEMLAESSSQEHLAPQQRKQPIDIESQVKTMDVHPNDAAEGGKGVNGNSITRQQASKIGIVLTNEVIVSYEAREGDMELKEPDMPWERTQRHWPLR
ncbi:integral membrane protein [Sarocladium implicatum]|nr:integral membrane protein [Sarocladium implicatum]